jgi:hypothetical protein
LAEGERKQQAREIPGCLVRVLGQRLLFIITAIPVLSSWMDTLSREKESLLRGFKTAMPGSGTVGALG